MRITGKLILIFLVDLLLMTIGLNAIGHACMYIAGRAYPAFSFLDGDNAYATITIHHVLQAAIGLAAIAIFMRAARLTAADFGFRVGGFRASLKPIIVFSSLFCVVQIVGTWLYVFVLDLPLYLGYKIAPGNFIGYFLFEVLLSGTSEEILFRSFLIVFVSHTLRNATSDGKAIRFAVVVISTIAFMVGHIGIDFAAWRITYVNWIQQATCVTVSIFYCWLFFRFGNIYSAMITHNALNGIVTIVSVIAFLLY